jgi:hypothetical protein
LNYKWRIIFKFKINGKKLMDDRDVKIEKKIKNESSIFEFYIRDRTTLKWCCILCCPQIIMSSS